MAADLLEVTVKDCILLVPVDGIFGGIYIDDEPPFASAPKEGVGRSADHIFQGFQPVTSCEDVVLKAREYGLAGPTFMLFTQGQPQCRISTLREAVIAILIACRNLIDPLAEMLKQRMIRMSRRSWIINQRLYTAKDVEPLIHFSHQEKTCIGRDLCALKINADRAVKFGPDGPSLFVTNRTHEAFLPLTNLRHNIRQLEQTQCNSQACSRIIQGNIACMFDCEIIWFHMLWACSRSFSG